jgi:hypothetical protein
VIGELNRSTERQIRFYQELSGTVRLLCVSESTELHRFLLFGSASGNGVVPVGISGRYPDLPPGQINYRHGLGMRDGLVGLHDLTTVWRRNISSWLMMA